MLSIRNLLVLMTLGLMLAACDLLAPAQATPAITPTPVPPETPTLPLVPTDTPILPVSPTFSPAPTATPAAPNTPTVEPTLPVTSVQPTPELPEESILILEPGPGSRLTSPARVAGVSDPTFEQSLAVRMVLDDGTELVVVPVQIQADIGQRGNFEVEVPFDIGEERQAFIQVYAASARDGGITHLAAVGVRIAPAGPQDIVTRTPHPEQIVIFQPAPGETVSGGVAHVEGFGLASFEQNLIVEVLDQDGQVIGSQPVTVQAPDLGIPGPFSADLPYTLAASGAGRIVVRDPSPAFAGDTHLSSVEITLEP